MGIGRHFHLQQRYSDDSDQPRRSVGPWERRRGPIRSRGSAPWMQSSQHRRKRTWETELDQPSCFTEPYMPTSFANSLVGTNYQCAPTAGIRTHRRAIRAASIWRRSTSAGTASPVHTLSTWTSRSTRPSPSREFRKRLTFSSGRRFSTSPTTPTSCRRSQTAATATLGFSTRMARSKPRKVRVYHPVCERTTTFEGDPVGPQGHW